MIKFNDRSVRKIVVVATVFLAAAIVLYGVGLFVLDESYRQYSRTTQQRQFVLGDEWHDADLKIVREFEKRHSLAPEANGGLRLVLLGCSAVLAVRFIQNK